MQNNQIPEAYTLQRELWLEEMQSQVMELEHKKTGAKVFLAANEDDNKVFTIGFRTPPEDSTGVPHIVEHCVLSGSRKYKTKEPFMNLIQGSLQTFLNAMTYPDRTLYPVASRNDEDFENLMDVYLDAVFYPAIYDDERIFKQEAWHHELNNDRLEISGVVYNEMRGAYSNPMSVLYQGIQTALFPDTPYAHESGGDPKNIPDLTYEDFLNFHRRYYHPSNSCVFIYGNSDMYERLTYLDEAYLSHFEALDFDSSIPAQEPSLTLTKAEAEYAIEMDSDPEGKTFYALVYALSDKLNMKEQLRYRALFSALIDESAAPLREALMDAEIAEDVFSLNLDFVQQAYGIGLKNAKAGIGDEFKEVFHKSLKDILAKGLDAKSLLASLNRIDFDLRECSEYPTRGIIYSLQAFGTWVFDEDVFEQWAYNEPLSELRIELESGDLSKFEEALSKLFDQEFGVLFELSPRPGLNESESEALTEKLEAKRQAMSDDELTRIAEEAEELHAWQRLPDTPEAIATIPKLNPSSVSADILNFETQEVFVDGTPVLCQTVQSSGTTYLELAFDLSDAKLEELSKLSMWTMLLGELNSGELDYRELQDLIYLETGGISTNMVVTRTVDDDYSVHLLVRMKTLEEKWTNGLDLLSKILHETSFEQDRRIRELLVRQRISMEQNFANSGDSAAALRTEAYLNPAARVEDQLGAFGYYDELCDLLNHWQEKWESYKAEIESFAKKYLRQDGLVAAISSEHSIEEAADLNPFLSKLSEDTVQEKTDFEVLGILNEAFIVPSQVQYVAERCDIDRDIYPYRGSDMVVRNFLSRGYLHNQVRAMGGAYGAGLRIQRDGSTVATSYRDPNLRRTFDVYAGIGQYLEEVELDQDAVNTAIIGSVASFDPPLTPRRTGALMLQLKLSGDSIENRRILLGQALETTVEDLKEVVPALKEGFGHDSVICVVGGREAILEAKELFKSIKFVNENGVHEV